MRRSSSENLKVSDKMETNGENINRTLNQMCRWNEIGFEEVSDNKLGGKSKQSRRVEGGGVGGKNEWENV